MLVRTDAASAAVLEEKFAIFSFRDEIYYREGQSGAVEISCLALEGSVEWSSS